MIFQKNHQTNYKSQLFHAPLKKKWGLLKHALARHDSPFPIHAKIEINGTCNAKCTMCVRELMDKESRSKYMSFEDFKYIIDQLPHVVEWSPHGCNEPMLHPDFFKFIEYTNRKRILFQLVTNGSRMTRENTDRLLALKPNIVRFSLDATGKLYEEIRQLSYRQLIDHLVYFSQQVHSNGFKTKTFLSMAVFDKTFPYIPEVLGIAKRLGFWITFSDLVIYDTKDSKVSNSIEAHLDPDTITKAFANVKELYHKAIVNIGFPEIRACTLPWNSIFIDVTGNVFPCGCISHLPDYSMGNAFQEKIKAIYNNQNYRQFRLDSCAGEIPECNQCKAYSRRLK